ncbi:hypothetical protein MKW92_033792 [Papaver armeniacum]|nr:hypothetical protein MKW92_033792 [Papaver armeniacum]
MEHTYQYAWIIPFVPLPVPIAIGVGLLLVPTTTKNLRRFWAFLSVLLLSIVMLFSIDLSIQQMNGSSIYQYLWSWTINNDFSLEFGDLIDPLTSIMLILITTVGIMVLIYSDNYMSHDEGYLRFFAYMSFSNTSMLGLVTSANLIQIYIFWELVGMCSYLLIGFWFTRPIAANACQKAFVTNRVGDFGLLLGILGLYWITGSFEFRDLFKIVTNLIENNGLNSLFLTLCAALLFLGAVAKSAQFPLHVWLPDAMEGPTPISALIHAATMVAAGIFLVARLYPLFTRSLAYSTMSQLGYIMLALGMGSYRAALFHLITHAYSKALLFLGSGSIIHCMESIVGYSPDKTFLIGTLSLCGIPPLACFWSKDEILSDSWVYSPIFAIIAYFTAGLTAFYMFRMYLLTFAGHLNVYSQNFSAKKTNHFIQYPSGFFLSTAKKNKRVTFFSKKAYSIDRNVKKGTQPLITFTHFKNKENNPYPYESENTMLFPLLILGFITLFVGFIGIPFDYRGMDLNILSNLLTPYINLLHSNSSNSVDWYEFFTNAILSVSIAYLGIFFAFFLYRPVYSFLQNLDLINSFVKMGTKRGLWDKIVNVIYNWSYNRGYIDSFYAATLNTGIRRLVGFTHFFDRRVIDGITNGVGITSLFVGEGIKNVGGGRISSYLFFYSFFLLIFLLILIYNNL